MHVLELVITAWLWYQPHGKAHTVIEALFFPSKTYVLQQSDAVLCSAGKELQHCNNQKSTTACGGTARAHLTNSGMQCTADYAELYANLLHHRHHRHQHRTIASQD